MWVEPKMTSIYFLPKIYKKKREDTGNFVGETFLPAVDGPLKLLDEFIARLTSPLLKLIPRSLNDTRELKLHLEKFASLPSGPSILSSCGVPVYEHQLDPGKTIGQKILRKEVLSTSGTCKEKRSALSFESSILQPHSGSRPGEHRVSFLRQILVPPTARNGDEMFHLGLPSQHFHDGQD